MKRFAALSVLMLWPVQARAELRAPLIQPRPAFVMTAPALGSVPPAPIWADVVRAVPPQTGSSSGGGGIVFGGLTGGTATRVLFTNGSGNAADDADLTFVTDTLTATKIAAFTSTGTILAATGVDIGATATPFRDLYLFGSGTFGTTSLKLTGTPTGARVITFQDSTHQVAGTNISNTFTAAQSFTMVNAQISMSATSGNAYLTMNGASFPGLVYNKTQTPDTLGVETGQATSNHFQVMEGGDDGYDFGTPCTAPCTDPNVIVRTHNQNATDYRMFAAYGSAGKIVKTLTESTATAVIDIPVVSGAGTGGQLNYTIFASDANERQTLFGRIVFAVENKGGALTCTLGTAEEVTALSAGTLTNTVTCVAATNAVDLKLNAVSSLTQTTLESYSTLILSGPGEPLPQ
jgi:hypothetical protein